MNAEAVALLEKQRADWKKALADAHRDQDWELEGFMWLELQRVEAGLYRLRYGKEAA